MFLLFISVILFVIFIAVITKTDVKGNGIKKDARTGVETIDLDVPNPMINPEKFLDFIETTKSEYLWQIEQQLDYTDNLQNIILRKAINEKSETGNLNKVYYSKILEKVKTDTYNGDNLNKSIDTKYDFIASFKIAGAFIKNRKENLIFNIEEGSDVILKREPYNKFDSNAIAIIQDKALLGYVPRTETDFISEIIKFKHIAKIADIIYINDFIDIIVNIYRSDEEHNNPEYYLNNEMILELRARKIDSKFLRPKKDAEDVNMFYKRKVVITGEFECFIDRNDLATILYNSGADIDTTVTERVDYLIVGNNPGWKKLEKAEDFGTMIFNEIEIKKILNI